MFFQRFVHLVSDVAFIVQMFAQGIIVKGKIDNVAALDRFLRQIGPVAQDVSRGAGVLHRADAKEQLDPKGVGIVIQPQRKVLDEL